MTKNHPYLFKEYEWLEEKVKRKEARVLRIRHNKFKIYVL